MWEHKDPVRAYFINFFKGRESQKIQINVELAYHLKAFQNGYNANTALNMVRENYYMASVVFPDVYYTVPVTLVDQKYFIFLFWEKPF